MMTSFFVACIASAIVSFAVLANAADQHDHKAEKNPHAEAGHEDSHDHADHGDHAEESEESSQVGPEKGVVAATADLGIKLSPEAEKHFEIKRLKVGQQPIVLPKSAIVRAGIEINVFRIRGGFYKRIDFVQLKKSADSVTLQSHDLKPGDEIALTGLGFLRTAEIAAFGGAPEGHSH